MDRTPCLVSPPRFEGAGLLGRWASRAVPLLRGGALRDELSRGRHGDQTGGDGVGSVWIGGILDGFWVWIRVEVWWCLVVGLVWFWWLAWFGLIICWFGWPGDTICIWSGVSSSREMGKDRTSQSTTSFGSAVNIFHPTPSIHCPWHFAIAWPSSTWTTGRFASLHDPPAVLRPVGVASVFVWSATCNSRSRQGQDG